MMMYLERLMMRFLSGALTSAANKQLEGRWAIFKSKSKITDVPESFPECGRDFSTSKEAHTENILR
jgi:hypothetical protein